MRLESQWLYWLLFNYYYDKGTHMDKPMAHKEALNLTREWIVEHYKIRTLPSGKSFYNNYVKHKSLKWIRGIEDITIDRMKNIPLPRKIKEKLRELVTQPTP